MSSVVMDLPLIGQPLGQLADGHCWQVDQQLREVQLRVHVMSAAGTGHVGPDRGCSSTVRVRASPSFRRVLQYVELDA
jgi:hypothetical protein